MEVIDHFYYTKEHEWVNIEENIAMVGITEYAQSNLGDITFIELPSPDIEVDQFEEFVSVESVKAASDIFAPMSGKIVEVNNDLEANPSLINRSCYEKGWIAKIDISDKEESSNLMTSVEYRKFLEGLEV